MMKYLIVIFLALIVVAADGQSKKRGRVKRKYRNVEQVSRNLPTANFRGIVRDAHKNPLPGASVEIEGLKLGVHTNEFGEFYLGNLPTGRMRIKISYIGYETKTIDFMMSQGENFHYIALDEKNIHLDPITVSAQKREQQILDVPEAVTSVNAGFLKEQNITELPSLSNFVPGFYVREQGANRPTFVIRGLTSDEVSPSAQPRISVFFNNVPVSRASGASLELFDMERVEVLKGPQNTLFGRSAQAGAVHFISKKPVNQLGGYLTAGLGNYNQKEIRVGVNVPLIENMLFVRAAGIYNFRDGYVDNTFGGTLNGKNTIGGRFSVRFRPSVNHKIGLMLNYQKDDTPGIAFMSRQFPNANGETGIFNYSASLNEGINLGTGKELMNATLTYKLFRTENTYWTSITSYRKTSSFAKWDGDGTAAPAIDMSEDAGSSQFYQEIRYNFSRFSRFNGSGGASFWREKADQTYLFSTNEQYMFHLFSNPSNLIAPNGQPVQVAALPDMPEFGPLAGAPLADNHEEENFSNATNQSFEVFLDGTYQLTRKFYLTGGIRGIYDSFKLNSEAQFSGGSASVLGQITGNYPNLLFRTYSGKSASKSALSFTWRGGLQYRFSEKANIFANYSRGRRPHVLQFTSTGEEEILSPEKITNYDVGFKFSVARRVYVDVVAFYQQYRDFQSRAWVADSAAGEFNYIVKDGGQATSYGAETSLKVALMDGLDLFGNYTYLHARFDSTNNEGLDQEYAGNTFRLSPEHSFAVGFNARLEIAPNLAVFVSPSYSYKTHFYFEDSNSEGLEQPAYGVLNANAGLELNDPNVMLQIYGTNLLEEEYITSAGNTGSLFGIPTFVPGAPRMLGVKLTWSF